MTAIDWYAGLVLSVDPDSVLDYEIDFADWLGSDTLAEVTITPDRCNAVDRGRPSPTSVSFRVSNVQAQASVEFRLATGSGQSDDFTIRFRPRQK